MSQHGYKKVVREDRWVPIGPSPTTSSSTLTFRAEVHAGSGVSYYGDVPSLSPAVMARSVMTTLSTATDVTGVMDTIPTAIESGEGEQTPCYSSVSSVPTTPGYAGIERETMPIPVASVIAVSTVATPVATEAVITTSAIAMSTVAASVTPAPSAADASCLGSHYSDEFVVDLLTRDPDLDCVTYCRQLYGAGQISLDTAVQLQTDLTRVQKILRRFSSNLIVHRAQVAEDPSKDPDAYLRGQLYAHSGQKL